MTGRERVRRCVEFDHPDRVPRDLWTLPIAETTYGHERVEALRRRWPSDFGAVDVPNPALAARCRGDRHGVGRFVDEWGSVFENVQAGVIGEVKHPLLDDWSKLDE